MSDSPLTAELLLRAYRRGMFPMARGRDDPDLWFFCPDPRAILPLDTFHCPRTLRQVVRSGRFDLRHNTAFEQVIAACAEPRRYERETWINDAIIEAYTQLHRLGHAHSVEAWRDDQLVGGLYGVVVGAAFCGESMFHHADRGGTDASKVCLVHLVDHLNARGFELLDVQFTSPHIARFGVVEIPREHYLRRLAHALQRTVTF